METNKRNIVKWIITLAVVGVAVYFSMLCLAKDYSPIEDVSERTEYKGLPICRYVENENGEERLMVDGMAYKRIDWYYTDEDWMNPVGYVQQRGTTSEWLIELYMVTNCKPMDFLFASDYGEHTHWLSNWFLFCKENIDPDTYDWEPRSDI